MDSINLPTTSGKGKGNSVALRTFESWGKSVIIGKKTLIVDGREMVVFMWCKLCAKYKKEISSHLKGVALTSSLAMANGTNYVSKHSVSLNTVNHFSFSMFGVLFYIFH